MTLPSDLDELRALQTPLIVYVGAELARMAGLPTRPELARILLDQLPSDTSKRRRHELHELSACADPVDAFTEFERELTPARFNAVIARAMRDSDLEVPMLARILASLGPRMQGIVTPNLDRLIERAFAGRLVTHLRPSMGLAQQDRWLLKTHGSVEDRGSWVFTRDQHARVLHRDPIYAEVFRTLFLAKPMLFVGTSLTDPILTAVIDRIRGLAQHSPPQHWALLRRAELSAANRNKLAEAGITGIAYETEHECLEILGSLVPPGREAPKLPPQPIVRAPPTDGIIRILFVTSNPAGYEPLALDREQRVIREAIERARHRDRIEITCRTAASFADLSRALLEHDFDLVHLSGHGEPEALVLEDEREDVIHAKPDALANLFGEYAHPKRRLRCVLFNACWSKQVSGPTSAIIATTIAMNGTIGDAAAICFAEGFYDAIGAGWDFAAAFREGSRRAHVLAPADPFDAKIFEH